jgi:hypothetical protein
MFSVDSGLALHDVTQFPERLRGKRDAKSGRDIPFDEIGLAQFDIRSTSGCRLHPRRPVSRSDAPAVESTLRMNDATTYRTQ